VYRTALRLLSERRDQVRTDIEGLKRAATDGDLRAQWLLNLLTDHVPDTVPVLSKSAVVRVWQVRALGETTRSTAKLPYALAGLPKTEAAAAVRLELASAALRMGDRLDTTPLVQALLLRKEDAKDPVIPQLLWLAYEKQLGKERTDLNWLRDNATGNPLLTDT